MPYRSKKQWRYFFSQLPEHAEEWAHKSEWKKLPTKVKKKPKNDCADGCNCDCKACKKCEHRAKTNKVLAMATEFALQVKASLVEPK